MATANFSQGYEIRKRLTLSGVCQGRKLTVLETLDVAMLWKLSYFGKRRNQYDLKADLDFVFANFHSC
jgi:hypothetical protein